MKVMKVINEINNIARFEYDYCQRFAQNRLFVNIQFQHYRNFVNFTIKKELSVQKLLKKKKIKKKLLYPESVGKNWTRNILRYKPLRCFVIFEIGPPRFPRLLLLRGDKKKKTKSLKTVAIADRTNSYSIFRSDYPTRFNILHYERELN